MTLLESIMTHMKVARRCNLSLFFLVKLRLVHLIYFRQFYQHLDHHFQGNAITILVFHYLHGKIIFHQATHQYHDPLKMFLNDAL